MKRSSAWTSASTPFAYALEDEKRQDPSRGEVLRDQLVDPFAFLVFFRHLVVRRESAHSAPSSRLHAARPLTVVKDVRTDRLTGRGGWCPARR